MKTLIAFVLVFAFVAFAAVPGQPTIAEVTSSTVTVKWNSLKPASFYSVYETKTGSSEFLAAVTTTLSYTTTMQTGSSYSFRVVASTFAGAGSTSSSVTSTASSP